MKFEKNTSFIDIDKDYLEVIKLDVSEDYVTKELFISPSIDSGQYRKFKITIEEFKGTAVPFYLGMYQARLEDDIDKLRFRYYEYANFVKSYLYGAKKEDLEINNLLSYFSKHLELPKKSVEALIKILITGKDVIPSKKGKKIYIEPSRDLAEEGRRRKFLTSIIHELIEKSRRVELLINHGGVIGSYREDLLINLLQKYLPSKFSVSSGFIEGCIRQIDIIVYDSHNYIPLFKENNIAVVKPESVRAIIEVKSTLRAKDLDESMDLIHSIDKYIQPIIPIFKGIFAFSTTYKSPKKVAERLIKYYNKGTSTGWRPNKLEYLFQCFDSICVLNEMFIFSSYVYHKSYDEKALIPHINTVKDKYHFNTSGANFLQRLFSYLDVENNSRKINNKYFDEIDNESEIEQLGIIHDEGWLSPHQIIGRNIMNSEQDFKDRFNNVVNWMNGEITTDELVEEYSKKKTVPNKGGC